MSIIIHKIALQLTCCIEAAICRTECSWHRQVKWFGSIRITGADGDAENIFGHNLGIVEHT